MAINIASRDSYVVLGKDFPSTVDTLSSCASADQLLSPWLMSLNGLYIPVDRVPPPLLPLPKDPLQP